MTFYFYDLETSSGSARSGRIMQFAGQRTDENLKPIGEPDDILVKLSDDVLPEPDAILVHRITPQKTLELGLTEAEFTKYFESKIATPNTVFVGFNNIRFDDEFMRRVCYRNFYDPYQWHWRDGRSRWDLLDPIRMMRALRPDGLKWPVIDGKPSVKLELMAKENGLLHENAHNALSDVIALIELAQKFKSAQPKLFDYLFEARNKSKVAEICLSGKPFVYTSGKYSGDYQKTTVVQSLFKHPRRESAIVYNLREDPSRWLDKSVEELVKHWTVKYGDDLERLPVKIIQFNKCPAVAPLIVLDEASKKRIKLDERQINDNLAVLVGNSSFSERLMSALDIIEDQQQTSFKLDDLVDNQIYDGFWGDRELLELNKIRSTDPRDLSQQIATNKRLKEMIPLYKARNFPEILTQQEKQDWESRRRKVFFDGEKSGNYAKFCKRLEEIPKTRQLSEDDKYLLEELKLYVESILPELEY
jgi:exodeoxyribonuclease-1